MSETNTYHQGPTQKSDAKNSTDVKFSITTKLLIIVLSVYLVAALAILTVQLLSVIQDQETHLREDLAFAEQLLKPALTSLNQPVSRREVMEIIDAALLSPSLLGIELEFKNNNILYSKGMISRPHRIEDISDSLKEKGAVLSKFDMMFARWLNFPIYHDFPIKHNEKPDYPVIKVSLVSNAAVAAHNIVSKAIFLSLCLFLLSLTLLVFFIWAGKHFLNKPLLQLTRAVEKFAAGEYELAKVKLSEHKDTELDLLAVSFNAMVSTIISAEKKSQSIRQHLTNILDSSPSIIIGVDINGSVTDWNIKAESFTKTPRLHALSMKYFDAVRILQPYQMLVEKAIEYNRPQQQSEVPYKVNRRQYIFDIVVYPLVEDGEVNGAVIRVDDVTQRKELEDVLVQTEKMSSIGRLAAGMAHEINNPLGAILQSSQNILRRVDPTKEKNKIVAEDVGVDLTLLKNYFDARGISNFLEGIRASGERAAKIVSNLLRFSRRSNSCLEKISVEECLEKAVELVTTDYNLSHHADVKHITFERDYAENLPKVRCEPTEIQQVFLNLLINAIQSFSSPDNKIAKQKITLRTRTDDHTVSIEIADNGPGMPDEIQDKIFEPFFSTKAVGKGTGLGLAVTYHIVTGTHGGTIHVHSKEGEGTSFVIKLPSVD